MKKILIFTSVLCILLAACKTNKHLDTSYKRMDTPYIALYKCDNGEFGYKYIILKRDMVNGRFYELYNTQDLSIVGKWIGKKDTLFLMPKYSIEQDNMHISLVDTANLNMTTIPQKFILKKDTLFDITDYSILFTGALKDVPSTMYDYKDKYVLVK